MRKFLFILALFVCSVPAHAETSYERVITSGEIRCGYTPYSVGLSKDPNTGELKGIYKEIIEAIGKKLELKIEWTEEIGWGQQIEGLNTGRYDMMCSPVSITGPRSKSADYSLPLYYSPVWAWVKADNVRFDGKGRKALNDPAVKISTLDGEQTDAMADFYFPEAQKVSLPQSSDFSALMLNVITGKADLTFAEPLSAHEFMEKNPNSLKQIKGDKPLTLVPNIFLLPRGQSEFKTMINNALTELFLSGAVDQAIDKYEKYPNSYVRVRNPE